MNTQGAEDRLERFIAGEDRLADLLRVLPAFEPPATMATHFAALARAAQLHYEPSVSATTTPAPMVFEAPASLEAGFLAEAARIQAAQQPRHDAVIAQIHAGRPASEVLGHDVTEATAQWLASRPERIAAHVQTPAPRAASKWWQRIGVVMASAAVGVVATNLWLAQREQAEPVATAMSEASVAAPVESASGATSAPDKSLPPAVSLKVEPIAQVSALSRAGAAPGAGDNKQRVEQRLRELAAEAKRAAKAEGEFDGAESGAADKARRDVSADRVREQEQQLERRAETLAMASARPAPVAEERMGAAAPAAAPPPPPAGGMPQERRAYRQAAPATSNAASPAAAPAIPAPKIAADRAATSMRFDTGSPPQDAAHAWASVRERAPRILAANPDSDAVRNWVERFRLALPTDVRPAQIHIERDTRLRDDALRLEE